MPRDIYTAAVSAYSPTTPLFRHGSIPVRRRGGWVAAALIATDVLVIEFCLYLGVLARIVLAQWFPIELAPVNYAGIAAGLPVLAICFYFMGLYPGYGISDVERLKQQETGIAIIFTSLLIWGYLTQNGKRLYVHVFSWPFFLCCAKYS